MLSTTSVTIIIIIITLDNLETECSILTDILVRKHTQNMENRKLIVTKERKPKVSSDVVAEVAEGSITENPIEEEESEVTSK